MPLKLSAREAGQHYMEEGAWALTTLVLFALLAFGLWRLKHAQMTLLLCRVALPCFETAARLGSAWAADAAAFVSETAARPGVLSFFGFARLALAVMAYVGPVVGIPAAGAGMLLWHRSVLRRYQGQLDFRSLLNHHVKYFPSIQPAVRAGLKAEYRPSGPWAASMGYGDFAVRYRLIRGTESLSATIDEVEHALKAVKGSDRLGQALSYIEGVRSMTREIRIARARKMLDALRTALPSGDPFEKARSALEKAASTASQVKPELDEAKCVRLFLWQLGEWPSDEHKREFPADKSGRAEGRFESIEKIAADPLRKAELGLLASFTALCADDVRGHQLLALMASSFKEGKYCAVQIDIGESLRILREYRNIVAQMAERHAYVTTLLMGMLRRARTRGVIDAKDFRWVRPMEYWRLPRRPEGDICCRRLWHALRALGAPVVSVEGMGAYAHFQLESRAGRGVIAVAAPQFWRRALDGYRECLEREGYFDPDFEELERWERL